MQDLEKLKNLVLVAKDLSVPFNYFFDLMDENKIESNRVYQNMEEISHKLEFSILIQLLRHEIFKRFGAKIEECESIFYETTGKHFLHGACRLQKENFILITVIYFSDIQAGMFAILDKITDIYRFSFKYPGETNQVH